MRRVLYLVLVVVVSFSVLHIRTMKHQERISHDTSFPWTHVDALPVWAGSRMFLRGVNPYSDSATRAIQIAYYGRPVTLREAESGVNLMGFAYPPQTAFVCMWLAVLPWKAASVVMFVAAVIFPLLGILVWLDVIGMKRDPLILMSVMASWPVLWGIRLENLSMIVIPAILIAAALYLRGRFAASGLLMAVCTVKPQLCWLLILWMLAGSIARRRWRFIAWFVGATSVLLGLSAIWLPGCFPAWLNAVREYRVYTHAQIQVLPLALATCALCAPALYRLRRDATASIGLVLALTVVLCPSYPAIVYNYLLLVPAALLAVKYRRPIAIGFIALEFILPVAVGISDLCPVKFAWVLPGLNILLPMSLALAISFHRLRTQYFGAVATIQLPIA